MAQAKNQTSATSFSREFIDRQITFVKFFTQCQTFRTELNQSSAERKGTMTDFSYLVLWSRHRGWMAGLTGIGLVCFFQTASSAASDFSASDHFKLKQEAEKWAHPARLSVQSHPGKNKNKKKPRCLPAFDIQSPLD